MSSQHPIDVGETYRLLARPLQQVVRFDVRAPEPVIEDACQFAWSRLIHHASRVQRESAFRWLVRTAVREALRLLRLERRELSLEAELGEGEWHAWLGPLPQEQVELTEQLARLGELPERQQAMLWLQALGLSYAEIGRELGCTTRTVERQLLRARRALR